MSSTTRKARIETLESRDKLTDIYPRTSISALVDDTGKKVNVATLDTNGKVYSNQLDLSDIGVQINTHDINTKSHNDIRLLIADLADRLNALADSDDTTLDQLSEIVAYIKSNKELIDAITTAKVSVTDIIDNLITSDASKPLSAAQGVALKALIDAITVPTKVSELENDSQYITIDHNHDDTYYTELEIDNKFSTMNDNIIASITVKYEGNKLYGLINDEWQEIIFKKPLQSASVQIDSDDINSISIPAVITSTEGLLVYHNGLLLSETINYTIDTTNNSITLVNYTAEVGDVFAFVSNS